MYFFIYVRLGYIIDKLVNNIIFNIVVTNDIIISFLKVYNIMRSYIIVLCNSVKIFHGQYDFLICD